MKKILAILLVALVFVSGAGCASKGDNAENNEDVKVQVNDSSEDVRTSEDSDDVQAVEETDNDSATIAEKTQEESRGVIFEKVKPKQIDENISGMQVYSTESALVVEKLVFADKRDSAESNNWHVEALVKNSGDEPIYFVAYFGDKDGELAPTPEFKTLYGGKSFWLKQLPIDKKIYSLNNLPDFCVIAHNSVMPETSAELTNFKSVSLKSRAKDGRYPFVDIHNVDLVVKDESKGWTSVVARVSSDADFNARVNFKGLGVYEDVIIPAGETVEVETPIVGNYGPESLTGISISPVK